MSARIEVFRGTGLVFPGWFYRLVAANGQTLTVSESYVTKFNARRAARKVAEQMHVPVIEIRRFP